MRLWIWRRVHRLGLDIAEWGALGIQRDFARREARMQRQRNEGKDG